MKKLLICLGILLLVSGFLYHLNAQSVSPKATIKGWADYQNLFIKDRAHNYGGYYYNRGLFRWYTPPMDTEYQTDNFTIQPTLFEDYLWQQTENGYRTAFGSINTPDFALIGFLKNRVSVSEKSDVTINAIQQEDYRAQRVLFILGYNHTFNDQHSVGFSHTLSQRKTDIDASFFYRYGNNEIGTITVEFTFLDWFNNIASDLALHRKSDYEIRHVYSKRPYLYSLLLESPQIGPFRGEIVAAFQPKSTAQVNRIELSDEDYILHDWVNYQAALLEFNRYDFSAGVIYQRQFAKMKRYPAENSSYELDFGNRQIQQRAGFYMSYLWRTFGLEQWFWIERNRDHQLDNNPSAYRAQDPRAGSRYPFDFEEIHRWNKTRIFYEPTNRGMTAYLEHNGDWRDLGGDPGDTAEFDALNYRTYYFNHIMSRNERLTLSVGYRFSKRFHFLMGASLDMDGDVRNGFDQQRDEGVVSRFDGGFARVFLNW